MSLAQIEELRRRASATTGAASVRLLQEAEPLAAHHEQVLFELRLELCLKAAFAGLPQVALVAFTSCLHAFDQNPNFASRLNPLLWRYKYVLHALPGFPQISREQLSFAVDDFKGRLKRAGFSPRTGLYLENRLAMVMGDGGLARRLREKWPHLKRDGISDCHACEMDADVAINHFTGHFKECIEKAEPLLKGRLRCAEVPHLTLPPVAHAYLHEGDATKAREAALEALRLTRNQPQFLPSTALVVELYLKLKEWAAALTLLERNLPVLDHAEGDWGKLRFQMAAAAVLQHVLREQPDTKLRLSPAFRKEKGLADARAETVLGWLRPRVDELIQAFDSRNGNAWLGDHLRELETGTA